MTACNSASATPTWLISWRRSWVPMACQASASEHPDKRVITTYSHWLRSPAATRRGVGIERRRSIHVSAAVSVSKKALSAAGNSFTTYSSPTANTGTEPLAKRVKPTPSERSRRMASAIAAL